MTLALGIAATFIGAALVIAGYTDTSFTGLLFGHWAGDKTGDFGPGGGNFGGGEFGGTADTGGAHAPGKTTSTPGGAGEGGPHR